MTDHAVETKAGPALYVAAASSVVSGLLATLFILSVVAAGLGLGALRELGSVGLIGFAIAAPVAIAASLMVHCRACGLLLIPLVFDGRSLFSAKSPSAWAIGRTAVTVVLRRRGTCPHCGAEARV
jgi:hypothetical protein